MCDTASVSTPQINQHVDHQSQGPHFQDSVSLWHDSYRSSFVATPLCAGLVQVCLYKALRPFRPPLPLPSALRRPLAPNQRLIAYPLEDIEPHPSFIRPVFQSFVVPFTTLPYRNTAKKPKTRQTAWHLCYPSGSQHLTQKRLYHNISVTTNESPAHT